MDPVLYRHGRRDEPKVALTFDDGPNPPHTDAILAVLAGAGIRATFFVLGKWVSRFPQALERLLEAGHTAGNHSYAHRRGLCDFDQAEETIREIAGRPTSFLRVPYLDYRAFASCLPASHLTARVVDADVRPQDFEHTDPRVIADRVLTHPRLAGGSIIVLHDGSDDDAERLTRPVPMIRALPAIINGLKERGLTPVSLDSLTLADPSAWPGSRKGSPVS